MNQQPEQKYVICNFINEYLEGYFDSGNPSLTSLKEDAIKFNFEYAKEHLEKLHDMGFTGLDIKLYRPT